MAVAGLENIMTYLFWVLTYLLCCETTGRHRVADVDILRLSVYQRLWVYTLCAFPKLGYVVSGKFLLTWTLLPSSVRWGAPSKRRLKSSQLKWCVTQ